MGHVAEFDDLVNGLGQALDEDDFVVLSRKVRKAKAHVSQNSPG
jgi:hypothetical protein